MEQQRTEQAFIAITLDDDSVAIMGFVIVGRGPGLPFGAKWIDRSAGWWRREPTDENLAFEISRTFAGSTAQPVRYRRVDASEVPRDRTFRNALADDGGRLSHRMPRAREIHLARLREARQPMLDQLDRDWMRANGRGDSKEMAAIEARRQVLRDLPATIGIEKAKTTDELKAMWPANIPLPKFLRKK